MPLLATQILWINLLTDSGLALALGIDPTIDDLMSDRPRRLTDRMIDAKMGRVVGLTGLTVALSALVAFDLELTGGLLDGTGDLTGARTHAFTTVVLAQIFNAFNSRSYSSSAFDQFFSNQWLTGAAVLTFLLQVLVVHAPFLNRSTRHRCRSPNGASPLRCHRPCCGWRNCGNSSSGAATNPVGSGRRSVIRRDHTGLAECPARR